MDFVLLNVAVEGFRSFRKDSLFRLPNKPGFYLLGGRNLVNPELGANATGKSSLWDALCWGLYGKTARGLAAGDVANWERDALCSVMVQFRARGEQHALTRTWKPNSLVLETKYKEPRPVTQAEVDELVGLDYPAFLHTVLMGQFGTFFFDLSAPEKLALFSDALGLGVWLDASKRAAEEAKRYEAEAQALELQAERIRGTREALRKQLEDAREASGQFWAQQDQLLAEARAELRAAKRGLKRDRSGLRLANVGLSLGNDLYAKAQAKLNAARDAERAARDAARETQAAMQNTEQAIRRLKQQRKQAEDLSGKCPTCLQHVKDATRKDVLGQYDRQVEWEQGELGRLGDKAVERSVSLDAAVAAVRKQQAKADGLADAAQRSRDAVLRQQAAVARSEAGLGVLRRRLADLKSGKDPHEPTVRYAKKQLHVVRDQLLGVKAGLDKASRRQARAAYWSKGFKEVRLLVVEEALAELEVECNNALVQLGLEGWAISFDVERENKSGGVARGFHVMVQAPGSPAGVPWKAWCGGETQRLRIAGARGFASLICNRKGVRPSVEVWDEPTQFLSEEGIQDLLQFFEGRAREDGKQIWLIDHRSFAHGGFDGHATVIKDKKGSRVDQKE